MNKIEKLEPPVGCAFTGNSISAKVNELIDAVNEHECCINAHTEWINVSLNAQEPKALEEYGDTWCACSMFGEVHKKSSHDKAKPQEEPKEEAIRYLKLILPMAKGYAAKNDAGSNQAYIEEVERFIKSQE